VTGFVKVGRVDDVPLLEGRTVRLGSRRVAIFRTPDGFHALAAACPHRAGPLADGILADSCVTCPLHGWRFDLRTGAGMGDHPDVESFEVVEREAELWLRLPEDLRAAA
jgi:nitrite reductase [NAD(P)H] small subunit